MFGAYPFGEPYYGQSPIGPAFIAPIAEALELWASSGLDVDSYASSGSLTDLWGSDSGDLSVFGSDGEI